MYVTRKGTTEPQYEVIDTGSLYYVVIMNGERETLLIEECTVVPEPTWVDVTESCRTESGGTVLVRGTRTLVATMNAPKHRFNRTNGLTVEQEQLAP